MWRLVSEGFRIYRWIVFLTWSGTAAGVALVFTTLYLAGVMPAEKAALWSAVALPMYLLLASAIPGWTVMGTEHTEKRLRLHLLLPVPLRHLALARILLPASTLLVGLPLAHLANVLGSAVYGEPSPLLGHAKLDLIAAHLLFLNQAPLLIAELAALKKTSLWKALFGSLVLTVVCVVVTVVGQPWGGMLVAALSVTAVTALVSLATVTLFCRRQQY